MPSMSADESGSGPDPGQREAAGREQERWIARLAFGSAALSLAGYVDPRGGSLSILGLTLGLIALLKLRSAHYAALLGVAWALAGLAGYRFGVDGPGHLVYDISLVFDGDLNFADEWEAWGFPPMALTQTGLRWNGHAVGAALVWLPAFLLGHIYAVATAWAGGPYPANGMSEPYLGATAAMTIALVVIAGRQLARWLDNALGDGLGTLSVVALTLASPLAYYTVVRPHMDHALVFAFVALFVVSLDHFRLEPGALKGALVGLFLGLATLCRPQTGPLAFVVFAVVASMRAPARQRALWLSVAAGTSALVFLPQMLAWRILFGMSLTLPHGPGWMDWGSPELLSVLISADHGLFNWHPLLLLGLAGFCLTPPALRWISGAGFFALAVATWVNGAAHDPAGSDAFGARRFDSVWPFFMVGLACVLSLARRQMLKNPSRLMALLLCLPVLWNFGLMRLFNSGGLPSAAPLHEVFAGQADELRRFAQASLFMVPEPHRSALVYRVFFGRYAYRNLPISNVLDLATVPDRMLAGGWSASITDEGGRTYRRAEAKGACLRVPLGGPAELVGTWTLWSSKRVEAQVASTSINRTLVSSTPLLPGWQGVAFPMPERLLVPGENMVCVSFTQTIPGETSGAFVSKLVLP